MLESFLVNIFYPLSHRMWLNIFKDSINLHTMFQISLFFIPIALHSKVYFPNKLLGLLFPTHIGASCSNIRSPLTYLLSSSPLFFLLASQSPPVLHSLVPSSPTVLDIK